LLLNWKFLHVAHGWCRVSLLMKAVPTPQSRRVRFEAFELDLDTGELRKNGRRIRLQDQPSRLLTLLVSRAGELVTRTDIQKALWEEGRFVEFDHAVNTAIKKVREALDDDPENPKIIETLPRKGYRFIAPLQWEPSIATISEPPDQNGTESEPIPPPSPVVSMEPVPSSFELRPVPESLPEQKTRPEHPGRFWVLPALALIAILGLIGVWVAASPSRDRRPELRVEVMTPSTADPTSVAMSPDGMKIVFVAISEGRSQLRLRSLDSGAERSLPGTDGALFPFWSPNNRSIGFFADGALKRTDIDGGLPRTLADAPAGRGGTWNNADVILFTPAAGGPIFRISANGDEAAAAVTENAPGSQRHPRFLPDNRHFLYFVTGTVEGRGVYVGDLKKSEAPKRLALPADAAVEFVAPNHVLFVMQSTLFAQAFDPEKTELSGDSFRIAEEVTVDAAMNRAAISASATGSIIYRTGSGGGQRQFVWFDRRGQETERVGEPDDSGPQGPALSSDGRHVAMYRTVDGNSDIWLMELERGVRERFTMDIAGEVNPVWSPDRRRIAFTSNRDGAYDIYIKAVSSNDTELVLKTGDPKSVSSWSPDGRYILYRNASPESGYDIWALPFDDNGKPGKPFSVVQTRAEEREAEFSPNGKWIAYQSNASGRSEVYIQTFPADAGSILLPVSTNGGAQPRWGSNNELFYIALDGQLMSVPIHYNGGREIRPDTPVALFPTRVGGAVHSNDRQQYVVSPDGKRFLMNILTETTSPIRVILNWKGRP
jgi:Tol biopolymer transport system component/DNA-binding winged helix-turn-helix (wHTH) protein